MRLMENDNIKRELENERVAFESKLNLQNNYLKTVKYADVGFFSLNGYKTWAKVVKVYDGDTITCVFFVNDKPFKFRCRFSNLDCAEKTSLDPAEVIYANKTIDRLNCLIGNDLVYLNCNRFDKYGRVLVDVFKNPKDKFSFNQILLGEGLAYNYGGGLRKKFREWALPKFYEGFEQVETLPVDNINDSEVLKSSSDLSE